MSSNPEPAIKPTFHKNLERASYGLPGILPIDNRKSVKELVQQHEQRISDQSIPKQTATRLTVTNPISSQGERLSQVQAIAQKFQNRPVSQHNEINSDIPIINFDFPENSGYIVESIGTLNTDSDRKSDRFWQKKTTQNQKTEMSYAESNTQAPTEEQYFKVNLDEQHQESEQLNQSITYRPSWKTFHTQEFTPEQSMHEMFYEIEVPCSNCHSWINPQEIDNHSLTCYLPLNIIGEELEEDINSKISKLVQAIKLRQKSCSGAKLITWMQLEELAYSVQECQIEFQTIMERLNDLAFMSNSKTDTVVSIFAIRLMHIAEQRMEKLNMVSEMTQESMLNQYSNEIQSQQDNLNKWKFQQQMLLQFSGVQNILKIQEIISDVEEHDIGSLNSSFESNTSENNPTFNSAVPPDYENASDDELEKLFISICIRKRLNLPKSHPFKTAKITGLYQKCKQQNIPISKWEGFLENYFNSIVN